MGRVIRNDGNKCPICGEKNIEIYSDGSVRSSNYCYVCPFCGEYFASEMWSFDGYSRLMVDNEQAYDEKKLKSYLFYHEGEMRPYLVKAETYAKLLKDDFYKIYNLTPEMVEAWYPKTFAEKIDRILLYLSSRMDYIGEQKIFTNQELVDVYFVQYDNKKEAHEPIPESYWNQIVYINQYLKETKLLNIFSFDDIDTRHWDHPHRITIQPQGWARIDELQKNKSNNKNVFIAMKFGKETFDLRDALKQAISKAGYLPVLIDEVQYNGQIVPEMLYQIRESRFVIAELSHHNNGAYYEAGFALGLGKEVIHICEEEAMKNELHFDVKQVNTITYKAEHLEELEKRLIKRIQATIK